MSGKLFYSMVTQDDSVKGSRYGFGIKIITSTNRLIGLARLFVSKIILIKLFIYVGTANLSETRKTSLLTDQTETYLTLSLYFNCVKFEFYKAILCRLVLSDFYFYPF